ncbi:MAG: molecular chaperone [Burkholderiales bacterium]|nr:MAG: molecular chaperone [Burkholderiales bacterium]
MKLTMKLALTAMFSGASLIAVAHATDLRVAPVMLEPLPGQRSTTLTVLNGEEKPVRVQVRVMRWTQVNGEEKLEPTTDVVASPPQAQLQPGQHYLIRVVRTTRTQIPTEEAYRVLVDEVPDPADARPGAVSMVVRQSIPVFFSDANQRVSVVDWSIARRGDQTEVVAHNRGTRRLRLSDIVIEAHDGPIHEQSGLVGYVLPGATMRFPVDIGSTSLTDPSLHLRGVSDTGKLEVLLVDKKAQSTGRLCSEMCLPGSNCASMICHCR